MFCPLAPKINILLPSIYHAHYCICRPQKLREHIPPPVLCLLTGKMKINFEAWNLPGSDLAC